jgi:mannitol 2-dehydrogenase
MQRSQYDNPTVFIEIMSLFGDLAHQPRFVQAYGRALDSRHHKGARATPEALVR